MGNRVSQYTIELEIAQGDKTRATIDGIERGLREISDAAKGGALADGMARADKAAQGLERTINDIAARGEDATEAMAAYDKAAGRAIGDLERQATALNHALSAQGKEQRARISEIEKELSGLEKTKENAAQRKSLESELRALKKAVVQGSDEELKKALLQNKTIRARLKMARESAKLQSAELKTEKGLAALDKADLATIKAKVKEQEKFNAALKTSEGRYKALRKAAGAIGAGAKGLAKGAGRAAGKAALIGGGIVLGIAGAAVASAGSEAEREQESARIKAGGLSDDDKRDLMNRVYVNTGADYTSIVDAINRVYGVIGSVPKDDMIEAATAEVQFPGASALFRQQTTGPATSADFTDYAGRLAAVRSATGATTEQIQAASGVVANLGQGRFSSATQTDLQALYLALQNSGAFDTQEELDKAFERFTAAQAKSGKDLFELAKSWDWGRGASATNRQQAATAMANVDWARIASAARETGFTQETAASETARKLREFEIKKDEILVKFMEAVLPILDAITPSDLAAVFENLAHFIKKFTPDIGNFFTEGIRKINSYMLVVRVYWEQIIAVLKKWLHIEDEPSAKGAASAIARGLTAVTGATPQRASGGVVTMPSLIGERGPEAVIPLDYSRSARAGNIMQNITQTFQMAGNETTALSLANVVKTRGFQRALGNASALNARLGR